MADCLTFTKSVNKNDFKDGDILWTQSYMFDPPNSHEIQGAVKLENANWKMCLVLASDLQDKHLVWPAQLSWRLCVVKNRRSKLLGSRDGMTLTKDDFGTCNWTDSIEVLHSDLERDDMTDADGSVTFMWFAELDMPVYSYKGTSQSGKEEEGTETLDIKRKEAFATHDWTTTMTDCLTFTKSVNKNDFKDGDILWTQSYMFDPPNSHEIQGAVKLENANWKICLVLASDLQDKHVVWPAQLSWRLCVVKNRRSKLLGSQDGMTLTKDDFGTCSWTYSIEVLHSDLERDDMTNADGSVTFMWFAELEILYITTETKFY